MHCCEDLARHVGSMCYEHEDPYTCPDYVIVYSRQFDEYGLIVHDGGYSSYMIWFCPFCGTKLPEGKSDRWFAELQSLGFDDPLFNDSIPEKYKTDEWWRGGVP